MQQSCSRTRRVPDRGRLCSAKISFVQLDNVAYADALNNPFSPGAGSPRPELAGRDELVEHARIMLHRVRAGRFEQSLMLVGLRGVGKTVLLNKVRALAEELGYSIAMIETTEGRSLPELLVPVLRQLLFQLDAMAGVSNKVKRVLRVLRVLGSTGDEKRRGAPKRTPELCQRS